MSWETPAKLMSAAYIRLGQPERELLQQHELSEIVFERLAFYTEDFRASDQNVMSKWTAEFTLGADENSKDLSTLTSNDILFPLWAERKTLNDTRAQWDYIPTVNLDVLAEKRMNADLAVAFSGENPNSVSAEFSFYGGEVPTPENVIRVRYSPASSFSANVDAAHPIPNNVAPAVLESVIIDAVNLLVIKAARLLKNQPEFGPRINEWKNLQLRSLQVEQEWKSRLGRQAKRSRTAQRSRNRSDVLGSEGANRYLNRYRRF